MAKNQKKVSKVILDNEKFTYMGKCSKCRMSCDAGKKLCISCKHQEENKNEVIYLFAKTNCVTCGTQLYIDNEEFKEKTEYNCDVCKSQGAFSQKRIKNKRKQDCTFTNDYDCLNSEKTKYEHAPPKLDNIEEFKGEKRNIIPGGTIDSEKKDSKVGKLKNTKLTVEKNKKDYVSSAVSVLKEKIMYLKDDLGNTKCLDCEMFFDNPTGKFKRCGICFEKLKNNRNKYKIIKENNFNLPLEENFLSVEAVIDDKIKNIKKIGNEKKSCEGNIYQLENCGRKENIRQKNHLFWIFAKK